MIGDPGNSDIWIYDIPRSTLTRLTFDGAANYPVWTPDGKRIIYRSRKPGAVGLFAKAADGSGAEERLTTTEAVPTPTSITPDGRAVAFYEDGTGNSDLWILPLEGERKPKLFFQTRFDEDAPVFSPDGRWVAYVSNESGQGRDLYVQPFPGPGGKFQISTEGGIGPLWARTGRELFYRDGDRMMAVEITTQPTFRVGTPRMLFESPNYPNPMLIARFDVSPDGQRFLMLKAGEQATEGLTQIHVVLNWFEELKRRVPAGR